MISLPEGRWGHWAAATPKPEAIGAGGGFERGERGALAVLLVLPGMTRVGQ
jgi:hypothetical protein